MKIINTIKFNTNNAWGFGGSSGTRTYYDNGVALQKARKQHRHSGTSSDNKVLIEVDDDFWLSLRRNIKSYTDVVNLKGISIISVLKHDDNYQALIGDIKEIEIYGLPYKRCKTINITDATTNK